MQEIKDFFKKDGGDGGGNADFINACLYNILRAILIGAFVLALILIFLKNCDGNVAVYPAG